jgi:hypothetical protein
VLLQVCVIPYETTKIKYTKKAAMPWLKRLVAGLSLRRPGLIHVGFVVDKVALGQVSLRVLRFFLPISFYHCSIFTYHHPMRCAIALTKQHHLGPKLGALFLTQHFDWKQNKKVKKYKEKG